MKDVVVIRADGNKPLQLTRANGRNPSEFGAPAAVPPFCVAFAAGVPLWTLVCAGKVGANRPVVVLARPVRSVEAHVRAAVQVEVQRRGGRGCGRCDCCKGGCRCRLFATQVASRACKRCRREQRALSAYVGHRVRLALTLPAVWAIRCVAR